MRTLSLFGGRHFYQGFLWLVKELKEEALKRYTTMKGSEPEQLVSGSDDFTLFLWRPAESKKPISRMTGEVEGKSLPPALHHWCL